MVKKWIDLSQPYLKGIPPEKFHIETAYQITTIQETDEVKVPDRANLQRFTIHSHQGTHVDAPKHMFIEGTTIDHIPLDRFVGSGVVLGIPKRAAGAITAEDLTKASPQPLNDDIVIIYTGFGTKYLTEEYYENPYLDISAAQWLIDKSIKMIGLDSLSVDMPPFQRPANFCYEIHRKLISNEVIVMENLCNLETLVGQRITVIAAPLNIIGADGSPARVIALLEE